MPWARQDAKGSTKKAKSGKEQRQWAHVANSELKAGKSEGDAKRIANGVIAANHGRKR